MVHWVIRQIDPGQNDEQAFLIASRGGPGDSQVDAIWNHSLKQELCIVQVKSSDTLLAQKVETYSDSDGDEGLNVDKFDGEAVVDLKRALDRFLNPPPYPGVKLQQAIQLYQDAKRSRKDIVFYPIVFGDRRTSFDDEMSEFTRVLNSDRLLYSKHKMDPLDLSGLDELLDKNFEKPVGVIQMPTGDWPFGPQVAKPGVHIALVPGHSLTYLRERYGIAIYHSNFRFMLGHTSVWRGMTSTLSDDQEKRLFHLYHNGITILGRDIKFDHGQLRIDNLQVVNGLQTVETLYEFSRSQPGDNGPRQALSDVFVFVRFIDVETQPTPGPDARALDEKIAEYSNKQNPIRNRDLRSNDAVQKRLQHDIDCQGYKYERKRGQFGRRVHGLVSNEKLAQHAVSFWLRSPADAKNKKQLLFVKNDEDPDGYYDRVFFKDVPSAALLVPYEAYERMPEPSSGIVKAVVDHGDFLLLAMFGEVFMAKYRMNLSRTPTTRSRECLETFHAHLRNGEYDGEVGRVWKQLVSRLKNYTQKELNRREREARAMGKPPPVVRNILFNLNYPSHRHELMPVSVVRILAARLPRL